MCLTEDGALEIAFAYSPKYIYMYTQLVFSVTMSDVTIVWSECQKVGYAGTHYS